MSSEQDQVVSAGEGAQASLLASEQTAAAAARTLGDAPRRRIVVAPRPAEKPIAFISRDPGLADQFEEQLGRARTVVVFPSLTHFCSDSSRMVWGGVVVARACGWDERLLGFVPSTGCIAFWRVAEEGYGWPASVPRLTTEDDVRAWLEEIAKPLPFQLPKQKRNVDAPRRAPRPKTSKPQLKFELATARGVVEASSPREQPPVAPQQMELSGLVAGAADAARGGSRNSVRPGGSRVSERAPAARASETRAPAASAARGTPRGRNKSATRARAVSRADNATEQLFAAPPRVSSASVLRMPSSLPAFDEKGFMKLAAELGLARATQLLDELRTRARSLR